MRYHINFATFDRKRAIKRRNTRLFLFGCVILFFFLMIAGLKKVSNIGDEYDEVRKKREELALKKENLLKERRKLFTDTEIKLLETKLNFYSDTFFNRLYSTSFLNVIEEKTPANIFLKSIDFDNTRKNFIITGESLSPESVASYISSLQNVNFIKKVEITRQSFQRAGEKKLLLSEFELRGEVF